MSTLTRYKLQPRPGCGFHFGELGLELEESNLTFPSDSLFAALVATVAEQEGLAAAKAFLAPFEQYAPPFRLTSLFPYAGDLPLLPLPRLPILPGAPQAGSAAGDAAFVPRKFTKKVHFVSPEICRRLCAGEEMGDFLPGMGGNGRFLQDGAIWLTAAEQKLLPPKWRAFSASALRQQVVWHRGHVTRVSVDRLHTSSNVYLMGRVTFNADCGLWLGVQYEEAAAQKRVEHLLEQLGDRGIGGERTSGYGVFTLQTEPSLDLPAWSPGNGYHLLLSRYLPREEEVEGLQADRAAYRLETVSGWLTSPHYRRLRRKQISMITEGSVVGGPVNGRLADVRPDWENFSHPVYRFGYALSIPATVIEGELA